ncbi:MAG: hypothetical protein BJ554DRAFT_2809 [Olpidium bornovanus]|uniref:Uncharacterized protein n=1 Tax=Olpidium bornovanus TaxID=278681 RepID=A0A8H7ZPX2_9FUNG|nr:MAG: hypothetical protein BJ554DRAFT_2809 [Olpidium bornovanus]
MLTRFTSILAGPIVSSSGDTADDNLVVALVAGDSPDGKQSREVFAVTRKLVQKWIVCKSSQEKFLFSKDFSEEVESRIKADLTEEGDLNIKVHDADFTRTCHLAILVSFCSSEEDSRRLCILFGNPTPTEFFVAAAFYPRFDRAADDLRGHEPRLALCGGGPAAFVFLPDSGTLLATVLPLHSPSSTPLFDEAQMFKGGLAGFGTDCWRGGIRARDFVSAGEAVVLVPSHGLVDVEVNVAMVLKEGKK